MTFESPAEHAEQAASVLAPESGLLADLDIAGLGRSLGVVFPGALANPAQAARPGPVTRSAWRRSRRWRCPAGWVARPRRRCHLTRRTSVSPTRVVGQPGFLLPADVLPGVRRLHGGWYRGRAGPDSGREGSADTGLVVDALAPTNYLPTNPAALKRALRDRRRERGEGDAQLRRRPAVTTAGRPASGGHQPVRLGEQPRRHARPRWLPQRADGTAAVLTADRSGPRQAPLLFSPPWINKYYVMDLAPGAASSSGRSSTSGPCSRSVTAIRRAEMSGITMDDYLVHGPQQALDVIGEITGARPSTSSDCAWGRADRDHRRLPGRGRRRQIGNLTLLNTMLDYSEPGCAGRLHRYGHDPAAGEEDGAGGRAGREAPCQEPSTCCGPTT